MKLLKRVTDIFSANLNDLIDQCENPERMLRQAVREMEDALSQTMDAAAKAIAHERLLTRQLEDQNLQIKNCLKQAEASVRAGNDAKARRELQRKAEHERLAGSLEKQIANASVLSDQLRNRISAMKIKLNEAKQKMADLIVKNRAAQAELRLNSGLKNVLSPGSFSSDFERFYARIEQEEAESQALLELLSEEETCVINDESIELELAQLKEKAENESD